jgi:hypothetical protein
MTVIIDLTIQHLLERKYKIENSNHWFSKSYWWKKSELKKVDNELQHIKHNNFTRVILPYNRYYDFTFDDVFEPYQEYYIFDDNYIPLGKYMNTHFHTEIMGVTDPVEIRYANAIFVKDSTGLNIYARNDTIISRPIYIKTIHLNSVAV